MNLSKAITQGWEECMGEDNCPLDPLTVTIKNAQDCGYNTHRNHVKEHYPKALERVIESLWSEIAELSETTSFPSQGFLNIEDVYKVIQQAKETLQELNQK